MCTNQLRSIYQRNLIGAAKTECLRSLDINLNLSAIAYVNRQLLFLIARIRLLVD